MNKTFQNSFIEYRAAKRGIQHFNVTKNIFFYKKMIIKSEKTCTVKFYTHATIL